MSLLVKQKPLSFCRVDSSPTDSRKQGGVRQSSGTLVQRQKKQEQVLIIVFFIIYTKLQVNIRSQLKYFTYYSKYINVVRR